MPLVLTIIASLFYLTAALAFIPFGAAVQLAFAIGGLGLGTIMVSLAMILSELEKLNRRP